MCVIGLGKRHGASIMHAGGGAAFRRWLGPAARIYETHTNLLGGLAVVENAHDDTAIARVLPAAQIGTPVEGELLAEAKRLLMRMPFDVVDVLVLKAIGKNISGTGMDTNVTGRVLIPREGRADDPRHRGDRGPRPHRADPRERLGHRARQRHHLARGRCDRLDGDLHELPDVGDLRDRAGSDFRS